MRVVVLLVICVLALLAAGCGGSGGDDGDALTPPTTEASPPDQGSTGPVETLTDTVSDEPAEPDEGPG